MPEPSELFKDTRIFLAAFRRHVAQLMQPACGCCGGLGDSGLAPTEPALGFAVGTGQDDQPLQDCGFQESSALCCGCSLLGVLIVGDRTRAVL